MQTLNLELTKRIVSCTYLTFRARLPNRTPSLHANASLQRLRDCLGNGACKNGDKVKFETTSALTMLYNSCLHAEIQLWIMTTSTTGVRAQASLHVLHPHNFTITDSVTPSDPQKNEGKGHSCHSSFGIHCLACLLMFTNRSPSLHFDAFDPTTEQPEGTQVQL